MATLCRCGESVAARAGQTLALAFARTGTRSYVAIAGGITTEPWLGARATFHKAGIGGIEGQAVKAGQHGADRRWPGPSRPYDAD